MHTALRWALAAALASLPQAGAALAQNYIQSLSFGHEGRISADGYSIKGWDLAGEGHKPQILSDRIIFTPPAPGHTRGEIWARETNDAEEWTADISFRASGTERGSGNFQFWYVKDGQKAVGSNSVYTVPKFDGLALIVDQHGGSGGMLRGFLSDGSIDYRNHHMVDSLSFGHCNFHYRNIGTPSRIRVTHDARGLEVKIGDEVCFSSSQVMLPRGNTFGLTAATSDNPDSFEVYSVATKKTHATSGSHFDDTGNTNQPRATPAESGEHPYLPNAPEQIPDRDAAAFKKQEEQFADLHNRLQGLSHQVNNIFGELNHIASNMATKQTEILDKMPVCSNDGLLLLSKRIESVERSIRAVQKDLEGRDYSTHLADLHDAVQTVKGGHAALPGAIDHIVKSSAPKLTTYVLVIVVVQIVLFGIYSVIKRRRDGAPKKYL